MSLNTFHSAAQAAAILATILEATIPEKDRARMTIGDDVTIEIQTTGSYSTAAIRATIFAGVGAKTKHGWTSIKATEERTAPGARTTVYAADLEALAEKIRPLLEPLKGYGQKQKDARLAAQAESERLLAIRKPIADRLVGLGLASWGDPVTHEAYRKHRESSGLVASVCYDSPLCVDGRESELKVSFSLPYELAEDVLTFLKARLGPKL